MPEPEQREPEQREPEQRTRSDIGACLLRCLSVQDLPAEKQCTGQMPSGFCCDWCEELLAEQGLTAGEDSDGVLVANNMCPSKGSMEIFVEPVLANPELVILGASPVAAMLAELTKRFGFSLVLDDELNDSQSDASQSDANKTDTGPSAHQNYSDIPAEHSHRYIVVATQGNSDLKALQKALDLQSCHIGFVGSQRKTEHLKKQLVSLGYNQGALDMIKGPAGLDIGSVTPQEIALSILAELIQIRRQKIKADN